MTKFTILRILPSIILAALAWRMLRLSQAAPHPPLDPTQRLTIAAIFILGIAVLTITILLMRRKLAGLSPAEQAKALPLTVGLIAAFGLACTAFGLACTAFGVHALFFY